MSTYPEIEGLKNYLKNFDISIQKIEAVPATDCFWVNFSVDSDSWKIIIEDEYSDFNESNPLICLFLVFKSLELYSSSEDFLEWNNEMGLKDQDFDSLDYYNRLASIYNEIVSKVIKIDSFISDYEYQLRTGVVQKMIE